LSIGAGHAPVAGHADPMMHITGTVDYIIVLEGEIRSDGQKRDFA
jgi:hypothetical protein